MSNLSLNVIIGIATAIIGILAFTNEFPDKKPLNIFKSVLIKLIIFIICSGVILLASIQKDSNNDVQTLNDKAAAKKEQDKRDFANRKLTDQSNAKIVNTFTAALAEYNLKYDASQKAIIKLVKDSAKRVIQNTTKINPNLDISNIVLTKDIKDSIDLDLTIAATKATAYNIKSKLSAAIEQNDGLHFIRKNVPFYPSGGSLSVDNNFTTSIHYKSSIKPHYIYLHFIGSYTNEDGKFFPIDNIYYYDLTKKNWGLNTEPKYSSVKDFFMKNESN